MELVHHVADHLMLLLSVSDWLAVLVLSALFAPVWHQRASMALLGAMGLCSCS